MTSRLSRQTTFNSIRQMQLGLSGIRNLRRFSSGANFHSILRIYLPRRRISSLPTRVEEETLSGYKSSSYYPVQIGEVLRDTYTIRVKLGYGRHSTTWLCTDVAYVKYLILIGSLHLSIITKRRNSFKVLKVSTANDDVSREAQVFGHLRNVSMGSQNPGKYCVRRAEDIFVVPGPNGSKHQCFVFEPLGPSLLEFASQRKKEPGNLFHIDEVRWMTIYFLHALDFLHEHGVVHTGRFKHLSPMDIG